MQVLTQPAGESTWAESLTKWQYFRLSEYKRVIFFDTDGLVMKSMNELFLLPPAPVAMPRAYWLEQPYMSAQITVIQPDAERVAEMLDQARQTGRRGGASRAPLHAVDGVMTTLHYAQLAAKIPPDCHS